jgi:hypothetical protein
MVQLSVMAVAGLTNEIVRTFESRIASNGVPFQTAQIVIARWDSCSVICDWITSIWCLNFDILWPKSPDVCCVSGPILGSLIKTYSICASTLEWIVENPKAGVRSSELLVPMAHGNDGNDGILDFSISCEHSDHDTPPFHIVVAFPLQPRFQTPRPEDGNVQCIPTIFACHLM